MPIVISDNLPLLLVMAVATVALWAVVLIGRRARRSDVLAGLRNGAIVGAVLGLGVGVVALLIFNGQPDALNLALMAGLTIGVGYFWLGAMLMPVGFLARGGYDWARYGTWVAIVIIIFASGLGYTAYRAFQETPPGQTPSGSAGPTSALIRLEQVA